MAARLAVVRPLFFPALIASSLLVPSWTAAELPPSTGVVQEVAPGSDGGLAEAAALSRLGQLAFARGDLQAAVESYEGALAIYEKRAAGTLEHAKCLARLGELASARADRKAGDAPAGAPDDWLAYAADLTELGVVEQSRGRLSAAETCHREAMAIFEEFAPGSLDHAATQARLGELVRARGELAAAEVLHGRALSIRAALASGTLDHAASLAGMGEIARFRGDLDAAEEIHGRALTIRGDLAPGSLELASSLASLGEIARARGDLAAAEELHGKALAIRNELAPGSLEYASSLAGLGDVSLARGDLAAAEKCHRDALALRERSALGSLDHSSSLASLGNVARSRGDLAEAESFRSKALTVLEEQDPATFAFVRGVDDYLGNVAIAGSDPAGANAFTKLLWTLEKIDPLGFFIARKLRSRLGGASETDDLREGEARFQQAIAIAEKLAPGSALEAEAHHGAGVLYRKGGRPADASRAFARAVSALEQQRGRLGGSEEVRAGFAGARIEYYRDYQDALLDLDRPAEAFAVLERSRARSLLAMLAERDLELATDVPPDLERARRLAHTEYDETQASIAALDPIKDQEQIETLLARMRRLRDEQEATARRIREASPRFASIRYPQPFDLAATREALDPGTVLLAYSVGRDRSILFVIEAGGSGAEFKRYLLRANEKALRASVEALRHLVEWEKPPGYGASAGLVARSLSLYATLIRPAERLIAKADRVLILPDGPLQTLPFGALVRGVESGRPRYFVEWKPIHIAPSATVYAELKRSRRPLSSSLPVLMAAFGDPLRAPADGASEFDGPERPEAGNRAPRFEPLPASRREVESITSLYAPQAIRYLGDDATEEHARALGRDIPYIHFACHAYFDDSRPLDSALVLATPARLEAGEDNGLLQSWEIFEKVRIDADLVTLSACETGLGREMAGEGLIGLTRAFQYAGARSVLASLWTVEDESTEELMKRFYAYLKAGRAKDDALRQAQIDLIDSSDASHPSHWAAFQLNGDWR